jgi:hypothetical protein
MFTLWDSLEAVKAFAGDDHETAVFYPRTSGSLSSASLRPPTTRSTPTPDRTWCDWRDTLRPGITAVLWPGLQPRGRGERVGFVVPSPSWFRHSTAAQNLALPMSLAGTKPDRRWLDTVVDTVRVSPVTGGVARMGKKVRTLSTCQLRRQ